MSRFGVVAKQPRTITQRRVLFLNDLPTDTSTKEILIMMNEMGDEFEYFDSRFMARDIVEDCAGLEDWPFDYTMANGFVHVDSEAQFQILPWVWKIIYKDDLVVTREGLNVGPIERVARTHMPWPCSMKFAPRIEMFPPRCPTHYFTNELIVIWKGAMHRLNDDINALYATCKPIRARVDMMRKKSGVVIFTEAIMQLVGL